MALNCPQCAAAMAEVRAEAVTGYLIVLDQCPQCGGIWCDRWELYPVAAETAARLDAVDQAALQQPTTASAEQLECPRCRARMSPFRDRMIPADARIERCPNCEGMWLNRGELRRFKQRHGAGGALAGPAAPSTSGDQQLDQLTRHAIGDRQQWPTVRSLSDFEEPAPTPDGAQIRDDLKAGALWVIARALLRLLLHV